MFPPPVLEYDCIAEPLKEKVGLTVAVPEDVQVIRPPVALKSPLRYKKPSPVPLAEVLKSNLPPD
jgi:hypothetical protein